MLSVLRVGAPAPETFDGSGPLPADAVWLDLLTPTREEERAVEALVGVELPTREDMVEIEPSSRLYYEDQAAVMTASILSASEKWAVPVLDPVTFVLAGERLVTIRYSDPKPFRALIAHAERQPQLFSCGAVALANLLEAIIDRIADILERTSGEVEDVSRQVFAQGRRDGYDDLLSRLGRFQNVNTKARESLVSLSRMISFCQTSTHMNEVEEAKDLLASQDRDVRSLTDHAGAVATNIGFLLDAALGLINIEQNQIIKVFSVFTVCLMPPTLIAAIYGMNFAHMPELRVAWAYPLVLLVMAVSGLAPLFWFARKRWL